ncbi:MAG: MFS transporter, partial [Gammaproteobacteria bacterium]
IFMLLLGMMVSALAFGAALADFSPRRLVEVIQAVALGTMLLNGIALWKQETRHTRRTVRGPDPTFAESWQRFASGDAALRRLIVVGVGTLAFSMADILLEPFGGEVLALTVSTTTRLTALLALGGLLGFAWASWVLGRGADPFRLAWCGALLGIPAFVLVIAAASLATPALFLFGNFLIGFGGALFGHGTLTATMNRAPREQAGLALGAWGAVQATAAGLGIALSGGLRDLVNALHAPANGLFGASGAANGYVSVYLLEIALLVDAIAAARPLIGRRAIPRLRPACNDMRGDQPTP